MGPKCLFPPHCEPVTSPLFLLSVEVHAVAASVWFQIVLPIPRSLFIRQKNTARDDWGMGLARNLSEFLPCVTMYSGETDYGSFAFAESISR
eukprot:Skav234582  [mRNA]  locus=scaffold313:74028:74303:+ [translate_table: standard]